MTTAGAQAGTDLERLAREAGERLEGATPQEVLRWAIETFGDEFCIASSMGDAVLAHMASQIRPGVPVVFLDTGYHFAETIGTRDAVAATYPVRVLTITPVRSVAEQDAEHGERLYERDPDRCCAMRKIEPLNRGLAPFRAWASGIRRDETDARSDIPVVDWDAKRGKVKVSPLAAWTQQQVDDYIAEHGVLVNLLTYDGYPSIGCAPCTQRVEPGHDPRSGRWAGTGKTECGLHV